MDGSRRRKLPEPAMVNNLYWLQDWSIERIAKKYKANPSAVHAFMVRHEIPRKPSGLGYGKRPRVKCAEGSCPMPPCKIKRKVHGRFGWYNVKRCIYHLLERRREKARKYMAALYLKRHPQRVSRKGRPRGGAVKPSAWIRTE